jgi:hypothetical protein
MPVATSTTTLAPNLDALWWKLFDMDQTELADALANAELVSAEMLESCNRLLALLGTGGIADASVSQSDGDCLVGGVTGDAEPSQE